MLTEDDRARRRFAAITRAGMLTVLAGCAVMAFTGCSSKSYDKFVPSETKARQALEAALTAWQEGKKPGAVEGGPCPVQAVDSHWSKGEKLTAYEIDGQETGEGPVVFSVRLTMKGKAQPITVRYFVVGKDPLWVYREEDFNTPAGGM